MRPRLLVFLFFIALFSVYPAWTQSPNGTISGLVVDSSGAAIVDAEILVGNYATGVQYNSRTNEQGLYLIPNLPPGTYRLQVSKVGFKTLIKPDITLNVQDALAINFTLPLGAVSEVVTITAGAPLVNTRDAAVSTVIDRQFVQNIPLNGQSFNTLMLLTPGTVIVPYSTPSNPGQFSINGQRTDANYFQVDGVGANFGAASQSAVGQSGGGGTAAFNAYGGTASLVSVDAMQEFRVETSSFAPEYGRTPGGQISISTRSGTNQFHGDAFDYFRNTVLDANDWFANAAGKPRAPEQQNDFGGVFGGPIVKDRTFFFVSYEGLRLRQPATTLAEVPSMSVRQSPSTVPAAAAILNAFPVPDANSPVTASGDTARFTGVYSNRIVMDAGSVRIDQAINSRVALFGRFNYSPSQLGTRVDSLSTIQTTPADTTTLTLGANAQFNPNAANSVRFNYSVQNAGQTFQLDSFGGAVPISPAQVFPPPYSLANSLATFQTQLTDTVTGKTPLFQFGTGASNSVSQWALVDDLSFQRGVHQVKIGTNFTRLLSGSTGQAFGPQYFILSANAFQQFLSAATVSAFSNPVVHPSKILFNELSVYGQDRWTIGSRLALTYGLRWEFNPAPAGQDTALASWLNTGNPAALALAPEGTPVWQTRYNNFAPRVGVAYRVTSNEDLVLRGGWGVFYDLGTGEAPLLGSQFPNSARFTDFSGANTYPVPITNVAAVTPSFSLAPPFTGNLLGFSPNLRLPYSYQWNAAIEKSFRNAQAVSITYLGQIGRRLLREQVLPKPNSNFSNIFVLTENGDTSDYHALQLQYKRTVSHGLQALLNYTWSHAIDTNSDDTSTLGTVPGFLLPVAGQRGTSDFDVRQNFSGAFVYTVPEFKTNVVFRKITEGWSLSGFALARTGLPVNVVGIGFTGGWFYTLQPDLVAGQPFWIVQPSAPGGKVLNAKAFAAPSTLREGNLARNSIPGFGATQFDTSVQRNFGITERTRLQFRADVFNVFNHPNFANPNGFLFFGPAFGTTTSMLNGAASYGLNPLYSIGGPRSAQLSLKLFF